MLKVELNSSFTILSSEKLSKNKGNENSATIFPPMYGNLLFAISKTDCPPRAPGAEAIKNIGLSFQSFPSIRDIQSNKFLKTTKGRLYFTGSNLLTFTDFLSYSPEQDLREGVFPETLNLTLGVNLTF